jgi:hypothetical protein
MLTRSNKRTPYLSYAKKVRPRLQKHRLHSTFDVFFVLFKLIRYYYYYYYYYRTTSYLFSTSFGTSLNLIRATIYCLKCKLNPSLKVLSNPNMLLTLSNPILLPTTYSPALIYFGRGRGWWITCNYPTVLKEKSREKQKEYNVRYLLAKVRTTREKASDRLRHRAKNATKPCRTSSDIGAEQENHTVGGGST